MRTPESVRQEAVSQFAWGIDFATRMERDAGDARADEELGLRLVDAALTLSEGELLDWAAHLPAEMAPYDRMARSMRVLPYLCGSLRVLDMEFAHADAGVVPYSTVSELLRGAETVAFAGHELTAKNVHLQYRRRALN